MAATKEDISRWFDASKEAGATHMIIVCDTFDYDDYPVRVMPDENIREKAGKCNDKENMQKVMEVYSMSVDKKLQMAESRAFHYEESNA